MLIDTDVGKAKALIDELVQKTVPEISIREKLNAFAEAEGLSL
jgi:hypothetical protein